MVELPSCEAYFFGHPEGVAHVVWVGAAEEGDGPGGEAGAGSVHGCACSDGVLHFAPLTGVEVTVLQVERFGVAALSALEAACPEDVSEGPFRPLLVAELKDETVDQRLVVGRRAVEVVHIGIEAGTAFVNRVRRLVGRLALRCGARLGVAEGRFTEVFKSFVGCDCGSHELEARDTHGQDGRATVDTQAYSILRHRECGGGLAFRCCAGDACPPPTAGHCFELLKAVGGRFSRVFQYDLEPRKNQRIMSA